MNVGELFAGIGGFGLAASRCGGSVAWAVEIDAAAQRVYRAQFPGVPVHHDVRTVADGSADGELAPVDVLTAGFPCQDLSVAGKRKGLVGERSGLFWQIIRIAERVRPRWLLLENVPGLFSSHRGRDFGVVLTALDDIGYGLAWTVLDAQHFGVPQRRRRVFVVGHLGAPCPAEVLFEPEGVPRHSPSFGEEGQDVAGSLGGGSGHRGWAPDTDRMTFVADNRRLAPTLNAAYGEKMGLEDQNALNGGGMFVAHALSAVGADASEDGTGRGTPIVASVVSNGDAHSGFRDEHGIVAHQCQGSNVGQMGTLRRGNGNVSGGVPFVNIIAPRRLTPRECERLQGFPDDWTLAAGSDSARYRCLGNAVAVPVVEWILRRLKAAA